MTTLIAPTAAQLAGIGAGKKGGGAAVCTNQAAKILRVTAIGDTGLTATNHSGATVVVLTGSNTIYVDGKGNPSSRTSMAAGTNIIVVRGTVSADGSTITAKRIRILLAHC
jgi:hypothetical protein